MSLTILNAGEQALLENGLTGVAYQLRLYKTDVTAGLTPAQIDALDETDFDEATFTGYAAAAVGTGDWTVSVGDPTQAVNVEKSFIRSATGTAETIWGYYVTRTSDGAAMWFEPFDGPVVVEFLNDQVDVTPVMTLDDRSGNVSVPIGGSILWSGLASAVPSGFLLRDGAAVSRTTYALLFAVIGEQYGPGDGSTSFNVPDQQGRHPIGVAASGTASSRGDTGGAIDHVHGLDSATSHAKLDGDASGGASPQHFRKTGMTGWTANIQAGSGGWNAGASTSARTRGVGLGGSSAAANPPFLADYFIIRAL